MALELITDKPSQRAASFLRFAKTEAEATCSVIQSQAVGLEGGGGEAGGAERTCKRKIGGLRWLEPRLHKPQNRSSAGCLDP